MKIRWALFLCALAFALAGCRAVVSTPAGAIDRDRFYAVLLNGGQVYFGKLDGLGTQYPVLTEVFYVQSREDPDTKQVSSVLVKRGKEWHAPDRMLINSSQIVLIEPVTAGSRVAQLIAQAGK
jgi:hypothetical protein